MPPCSGCLLLLDADPLAVLAEAFETDHAIGEGKQGIVAAVTHILTRVDMGAALTNQDIAGQNPLAVGALDAETLGLGIAAVVRGAAALLCAKN